jgi:hypothetical protein
MAAGVHPYRFIASFYEAPNFNKEIVISTSSQKRAWVDAAVEAMNYARSLQISTHLEMLKRIG